MAYRRLGNTGLKVSVLSYGTMTFKHQNDLQQAKELLTVAREGGINFFDNAEVYGGGQAEQIVGDAIRELGWKRSDIVLSTKIFFGAGPDTSKAGPNDRGLSRTHLIEGTKAALKRLQTDYVDLIFAHRPDPDTPMEETVRAFNHIIDQGWAFYWGTSEWSVAQIQEAWDIAKRLNMIGPAYEQPEYNLFNRQKVEVEYQPLYEKYGLGTTVWSPIAGGILSGKYKKGQPHPEGTRYTVEAFTRWGIEKLTADDRKEAAAELEPIAQELGATVAQLALAWTIRNPRVSTAIIGSTKVDQLKENLAAVELLPKLTDDVVQRIETIFKPWAPSPAGSVANGKH